VLFQGARQDRAEGQAAPCAAALVLFQPWRAEHAKVSALKNFRNLGSILIFFGAKKILFCGNFFGGHHLLQTICFKNFSQIVLKIFFVF